MSVAGLWDRVKSWVGGGDAGDGELGRDDLLRQVTEGVGGLSRYGAKGARLFPEEVRVTVTIADGGLLTVQAMLADASFERDLEARMQNAFPDHEGPLPIRGYEVVSGPSSGVVVTEARRSTVLLQIDGGDRTGESTPAPPGRKVLYAGRGLWHGPGEDLRNDIVLTDSLQWVPRRAFRLERRGTVLVVHPLDADDAVEVVRADGTRVRPARMPHGTAELRLGERLELRGRDNTIIAVWLLREET